MKKRVLVVLGHPSSKSLDGFIADSYLEGVRKNFSVKKIYLSEIKFEPILKNGYKGKQTLEKDLVDAQKKIKWADHIVFVYPVWWGSPPAILKGFFERTLLPGFAFKYVNGKQTKFLGGKTASIIMTTGGSKWKYFLLGWLINLPLTSGLMSFCGIKHKGTYYFCKIRSKMLPERIEEIGAKSRKLGEKGF